MTLFLGGRKMLETGSRAIDFNLEGVGGQQHALSDYKGKWVVLYFYPKDGTKG